MKESNKLDFSELVQELGGFGRYQKFIFFLSCLTVFMPGMAVVNIIFVGNELPHCRCVVPQCEFVGNSSYNEDFLNFTTPAKGDSWDKCDRFKTIDTRDMSCDPINFNPHLKKKCSQYIYDTSVFKSTTVSEFNLVCDDAWWHPMATSAFMVGMFCGGFILGNLADRIGRKKGLCLGLFLFSSGGILNAVSYNYYMFLLTRFLTGFGSVSVFSGAFICVIEFSPIEYRNFVGILVEIPFALGEAFVAAFAYFIRDWRYLQVACSIPPMFLLTYYWLMPESIRWSISQGRIEEAKTTIKRLEKWNKVKVSDRIMQLVESSDTMNDEKERGHPEVNRRSALDLVRYPNIRRRTLILVFCWIVVTLSYYGLSLNSANLGGDLFVNFVLVMLIEVPSYILAYLILDRIGRKWSLILTYGIAGLGCLASGIVPARFETIIVVLSMMGKFGIASAFAIIYVYTAEIFPTSMRCLGIGCCSTAARLGGIVAPFIANLSTIYPPLPLFIFGVLGLLAGLLFLTMPETYGSELPQTIQESETFGKDQAMFEFPCCTKKKKMIVTPKDNEAFSEI